MAAVQLLSPIREEHEDESAFPVKAVAPQPVPLTGWEADAARGHANPAPRGLAEQPRQQPWGLCDVSLRTVLVRVSLCGDTRAHVLECPRDI